MCVVRVAIQIDGKTTHIWEQELIGPNETKYLIFKSFMHMVQKDVSKVVDSIFHSSKR